MERLKQFLSDNRDRFVSFQNWRNPLQTRLALLGALVGAILLVASFQAESGHLRIGNAKVPGTNREITIMCWDDRVFQARGLPEQEEANPTIMQLGAKCPSEPRPVAFVRLEHSNLFWIGVALVLISGVWQVGLVRSGT